MLNLPLKVFSGEGERPAHIELSRTSLYGGRRRNYFTLKLRFEADQVYRSPDSCSIEFAFDRAFARVAE